MKENEIEREREREREKRNRVAGKTAELKGPLRERLRVCV